MCLHTTMQVHLCLTSAVVHIFRVPQDSPQKPGRTILKIGAEPPDLAKMPSFAGALGSMEDFKTNCSRVARNTPPEQHLAIQSPPWPWAGRAPTDMYAPAKRDSVRV